LIAVAMRSNAFGLLVCLQPQLLERSEIATETGEQINEVQR